MTRSVPNSTLERILANKIPLPYLVFTRIDKLQAERQSALYKDAVGWLNSALEARGIVQAAKDYISRTGCVSETLKIPYYLFFSRACYHYIHQNAETAQAEIEALASSYISQGYDASVLQALARLQNVTL